MIRDIGSSLKRERERFGGGQKLPLVDFVEHQTPFACSPLASWVTPAGNIWAEVYLVGSGYVVRFLGICDFRFSNTDETVRCSVVAGQSELDIRHLFQNTIVPCLWSIMGHAVYHAGAVRVNDGSIVFLGASGRGKSTLATAFALSGYPFLTDDVLPIYDGLPPVACPHASSVRLWKNTVDGLFPRGCEVEAYSTYTSKTRVVADKELKHSTEPARITAAFVLGDGRSQQLEIRKLDGRYAHAAWLENMFVLDPTDRKVFRQLFERTSEIAGSVPTYALDFPRDFDLLPEVRKKILDTVALGEAAC